MKTRLSTSDFKEILYDREYPINFRSDNGVDETNIRMNYTFGEVDFRETCFEGVRLTHGQVLLSQDLSVNIEQDTPIIEMHFSVSGHSHARLGKQRYAFKPREHNIMYVPEFSGSIEAEKQDKENSFIEVHFTESYFRRLQSIDSHLVTDFLTRIDKKQMGAMNHRNMHITPQMDALLHEITHCQKKGVLKRLFLEAKVLELLMLQMEQFESAVLIKPAPLLKGADIDKIHHARLLIEQNLSHPYSLLELSHQVGLNDFKLKKGFKEVFGNTVFGYLHDLRMQEARRLLTELHKPIWEVAEYCGYEYVQHFSTAFKKKFGVTPGSLRP